jgi:hypothetical protein
MRKRIACINESPICPEERRIAVDESEVVRNAWLAEQGLSTGPAGGGGGFPLAGGDAPCY